MNEIQLFSQLIYRVCVCSLFLLTCHKIKSWKITVKKEIEHSILYYLLVFRKVFYWKRSKMEPLTG